MRKNDAQDDAIEGFDSSELPPMGPDGIQGAEDRKLPPAPPRLCEAGPCVHYHRFAIQLDVEGPKADAIEPGGRMTGAAPKQPFHVRIHHYCYPDVGIETELGGLPVLECNRWKPIPYEQRLAQEQERESFMMTEVGRAYQRELDEWRAARAAEAELEDDPVATWLTIHLRDGDVVRILDAENTALEIMDADTARAFLTTSSLRANHGGAAVRLETVTRKDFDDPGIVTNTLILEVK